MPTNKITLEEQRIRWKSYQDRTSYLVFSKEVISRIFRQSWRWEFRVSRKYETTGSKMSLKIHFMHSHVDLFLSILGMMSDEQLNGFTWILREALPRERILRFTRGNLIFRQFFSLHVANSFTYQLNQLRVGSKFMNVCIILLILLQKIEIQMKYFD